MTVFSTQRSNQAAGESTGYRPNPQNPRAGTSKALIAG
jgi:hypothetical protein